MSSHDQHEPSGNAFPSSLLCSEVYCEFNMEQVTAVSFISTVHYHCQSYYIPMNIPLIIPYIYIYYVYIYIHISIISHDLTCKSRAVTVRLSALNRSADCLKPTLLPPLILGGLAAQRRSLGISAYFTNHECVCVCLCVRTCEGKQEKGC